MIPVLVVTSLVLLVAGLLAAAEWRFHVRPNRLTHESSAEVVGALFRLACRPETRGLRLRVEVVDGIAGQVEGMSIAATSEIERAWRPWGSRRYLIRVDGGRANVRALVLWEAVHRCLRHSQGRGWGPPVVRLGDSPDLDLIMARVQS